jgi:hypothetical protein
MPQDDNQRSELSQSIAAAWDEKEDAFADLRDPAHIEEQASIGGLRRRRRSASNIDDEPIKSVSLVEKDGVLLWCDDIAAGEPVDLGIGRRRRRMLRRAGLPAEDEVRTPSEMAKDPVVLTRTFPKLEPNKITAAVGRIDQHLNDALDNTLRARLRPLRRAADGTFSLGEDSAAALAGKLDGRILLFVHGTFSNATSMLGEFIATPEGNAFLNAATNGASRYKNVLFFEHATLAVSPIVNALELGRMFANASGQIDVIAHSRGGLVVRWWLEAFGKSLNVLPAAPVRAVLVGSPLNGTSLAAPDKLQGALSLVSNIGSVVQTTLGLAGAANPFLWAAGKLVQVVVSATGALARTPLVDGVVALIPGLSGQSMVSNNFEINNLRLGPCAIEPRYYAVRSNFETADPGWKFWQYFRKSAIADIATNHVFPGQNDLVVDTASMVDFGVPRLVLADKPCDFGTSATVWHCNYFRQPETVDYITRNFT